MSGSKGTPFKIMPHTIHTVENCMEMWWTVIKLHCVSKKHPQRF